jgi:hypothetical protein
LPIVCILDEFQNFIGPDFEYAIPEVRQKGVRLVCAHQSYSQLVRGDTDLRGIIPQLQNRLVFGMHGEDADIAAHEQAALTFDPNRVKDELYSTKQRLVRHNVMELQSWSQSDGKSESGSSTSGSSSNEGRSRREDEHTAQREDSITRSTGASFSSSVQNGYSNSTTSTRVRSQTLVPVYEEYQELSSRSYVSFQEQEALWAQKIRQLPIGHALLKVADWPVPREVRIQRSAPGFLNYDMATIHRRFPRAVEDTHRLIEENFARGPFCTPEEIERESVERLNGHIVIPVQTALPSSAESHTHPFRGTGQQDGG